LTSQIPQCFPRARSDSGSIRTTLVVIEMSIEQPWLRWAIAKSTTLRSRINAVTGRFNQWPIIIGQRTAHLPIDQLLPTTPACIANDNGAQS
jgi:hypothetical protein